MADRVRPLKLESPASGGTQTDEWPTGIDPNEDHVDARGVFLQNNSSNDEVVHLTRDSSDRLTFKDTENTTPVPLTDLIDGEVDEENHAELRQLIHLADGVGGPFEYWGSAYREITGGAFPTNITWWTDSSKTAKIVEKQIAYTSAIFPSTITYIVYDSDGSTPKATAVDTLTWSGPFESSRARTITVH